MLYTFFYLHIGPLYCGFLPYIYLKCSLVLQINRPLKHNSTHTASQDHRPKPKVGRRPFEEEEDEMDISNMIRSMFK